MHPGRSARDHLRAAAALSGLPPSRVHDVLAEVGLTSVADQRSGGFSLGMRQRLALAGALLGQPQVLILNEPANGLDPDGIRWMRTYLRSFAQRGGAVFVSSHLISELASFADDLVVIGGGRLLAADRLAAFTADPATEVLVQTPDPVRLANLLAGHGATVERTGDRLTVRGATRPQISQLTFDHRIRLLELTDRSPSLEDRLLDLTRTAAEFTAA
jgi:ABC-2 type transport system ATP-binding protein